MALAARKGCAMRVVLGCDNLVGSPSPLHYALATNAPSIPVGAFQCTCPDQLLSSPPQPAWAWPPFWRRIAAGCEKIRQSSSGPSLAAARAGLPVSPGASLSSSLAAVDFWPSRGRLRATMGFAVGAGAQPSGRALPSLLPEGLGKLGHYKTALQLPHPFTLPHEQLPRCACARRPRGRGLGPLKCLRFHSLVLLIQPPPLLSSFRALDSKCYWYVTSPPDSSLPCSGGILLCSPRWSHPLRRMLLTGSWVRHVRSALSPSPFPFPLPTNGLPSGGRWVKGIWGYPYSKGRPSSLKGGSVTEPAPRG